MSRIIAFVKRNPVVTVAAAAALITICRRRLTTTQEELNQVLAQLNS